MDRVQIDGGWISAQLDDKRGEQARLARYLNIDNDKMSKTILGIRAVQTDEVIPLLIFFGYTIIPPGHALGALYDQWQESAKADRDVLLAAARGLRAQPLAENS